jgi:hypothetical protein
MESAALTPRLLLLFALLAAKEKIPSYLADHIMKETH